MTKFHSFESERLLYKGISEGDTDLLVRWRSDCEVIRYFRSPEPITRQEHLKWLENSYMTNFRRFDFIIIEKLSENAIGTVGANNVDFEGGTCEISYMVAERNFQRKGYASEAVLAIMESMRNEGVRKFFAEIHNENEASIYLVEKLGFSHCSQQDAFSLFIKSED